MKNSIRASYFTSCILTFFYAPLFAQFSNSLNIAIGTTATLATKDYQPLWLESLQFGTISHQQTDISTHVLVTNVHFFDKKWRNGKIEDSQANNFYISYGIDLYNNNHFEEIFTKEAYIKAGYKTWEIRAGQFAEIIGEVDPELSSGSFAVSGNALPIPKIGLAVTDYITVPLPEVFSN